MANANLFYSLMRSVEIDPGRVLFHVEDGTSLSYGDVADRSAQFANALVELGVKRVDRLVVQVDKSTDAIALWLGCLRAGVMFVPLNTAAMPMIRERKVPRPMKMTERPRVWFSR